MTQITRRTALAGGAALAAGSATAAAQAERRFAILRDGDDVGRHVVRLTRDGDRLQADVEVEIVVRVLGIAAYRYEMTNREIWAGGLLQSVDSRVNDDGRRKTVRVARQGDRLRVESPFYTGDAPGDAATTTYFSTDFLQRRTWISTDSGELYAMSVARSGAAEVRTARGSVPTTRWRATNGSDFDVALYYDARGEWASVAFDAGGEPAIYVPQDMGDSFMAVWNG